MPSHQRRPGLFTASRGRSTHRELAHGWWAGLSRRLPQRDRRTAQTAGAGARRPHLWHDVRHAQVAQDALDDRGLLYQRHQLQPAGTARARQHVTAKAALPQCRPCAIGKSTRTRRLWLRSRRGAGRRLRHRVRVGWHHRLPPRRTWASTPWYKTRLMRGRWDDASGVRPRGAAGAVGGADAAGERHQSIEVAIRTPEARKPRRQATRDLSRSGCFVARLARCGLITKGSHCGVRHGMNRTGRR